MKKNLSISYLARTMITPIKVQLIVVKIVMIFMNLRAKVTLFTPKQIPMIPLDDDCMPSGTDKTSDIRVEKWT